MKPSSAIILLCAMMIFFPTTQAAEQVDILIRGILRAPPPCRINDGGVVAVDFGQRVGVNKVDGINYRQAVNYRINCDSTETRPWKMSLTLKGNATDFDKAAIQTDNGNLGIRIYQDNVPFTLNSSIKIDPANPPRLEAVPIAKPGEKLSGGAFAATAILQADYL